MKKEKISPFFILSLILVSFSMRSPMGAVGPLLDKISSSLSLSSTLSGLITTLPLILFSLSAPIGSLLVKKAKLSHLIPLYVLVVTLGVVIRSFFGITGLFIGTALIGIGTGLLNSSIPAFLKSSYKERFGLLNGIYSSSMTLSSALTATLVGVLFTLFSSWKYALLLIAVLTFTSFIFSFFSFRKIDTKEDIPSFSFKNLLNSRNISIALFMGFQALIFYSMLSWYPEMCGWRFSPGGNKGVLFTILQLSSLIPAFLVPLLAKKNNIRILSSSLALLFIPGILIAYYSNSVVFLLFGTICCGISLGGTFSSSISFCSISGRNAVEVATLTSFGQCIGYLISSFGPVLIGYSYDKSASWNITIGIFVVLSLFMVLFSFLATRKENLKN